MKSVFVLAALALLLFGCSGPAQQPQKNDTVPQPPPAQPPPAQTPPQPPPSAPPAAPPPAAPPSPPPSGGTTTQEDCATMAPNCGSCISKAGCGWCKSSSACFKGDSGGPAGDIQCQPADWAVTQAGCQAPTSPQGSNCAEQVGCGNCLSGDACKFCRQGAVCADANSGGDCLGGWITDFYVCAAGSQ